MKITPDAPDDLVGEYLALRAERDKAQSALDEATERLMKQMEADQRKSFRWTANGRAHSLTFVRRNTVEVDEPGLRKALTAKVFDRYTKRVLDRKRMETAIEAGEVDPITVSRFTTLRPAKAYLDYREREAE